MCVSVYACVCACVCVLLVAVLFLDCPCKERTGYMSYKLLPICAEGDINIMCVTKT